MVLCVCGFENVLKKMPCLGNLCNNSFECFTKVVVFLKRCFNVLKVCFESCVVECVLKNGKDVFASFFDQVTKSFLPYFTQRSFLCF